MLLQNFFVAPYIPMPKGRGFTANRISASFLTAFDEKVIKTCEEIAKTLKESIPETYKSEFWKEFGKISFTRDGGLGLGGGKLQRDTLCTRGRSGKAPFSNRNLRWHPLVAAACKPQFAKEIERIEIADDTLVFIVKDKNGNALEYPADKAHEMPERYAAASSHWQEHSETLKNWNDTQWTQNSCVIPALEACEWYDGVETFALLGIATAVALYKADYQKTYNAVIDILKNQSIDKKTALPSRNFPKTRDAITVCPVTKISIAENLDRFRKTDRGETWQPDWRKSKKDEGDDASIQIMHVNPLLEYEIRHRADNVRYGFRWANTAMTDHSLDETLDFMEHIVRAHGRV
jgi:hypothetical protein